MSLKYRFRNLRSPKTFIFFEILGLKNSFITDFRPGRSRRDPKLLRTFLFLLAHLAFPAKGLYQKKKKREETKLYHDRSKPLLTLTHAEAERRQPVTPTLRLGRTRATYITPLSLSLSLSLFSLYPSVHLSLTHSLPLVFISL